MSNEAAKLPEGQDCVDMVAGPSHQQADESHPSTQLCPICAGDKAPVVRWTVTDMYDAAIQSLARSAELLTKAAADRSLLLAELATRADSIERVQAETRALLDKVVGDYEQEAAQSGKQ